MPGPRCTWLVGALALAPAAAWLQPAPELPARALSGGQFSVADDSQSAYTHPTPALDAKQKELFALGHQMFNNRWAFFWFENAEFGRGPTSNAQACTACHTNNGRGLHNGHAVARDRCGRRCARPPHHRALRAGAEPGGSHQRQGRGRRTADRNRIPYYGDQLQVFGVKGVIPAEGKFDVQWREQIVTLADGEQVALRAPTLTISELAYGPLGADAMTGLRLAPPLIGLGLLEAIPEETIVQLAARAPVAGIRGTGQSRVGREPGQDRARALRLESQPRQPARAGRGGLHQRHRAEHAGLSRAELSRDSERLQRADGRGQARDHAAAPRCDRALRPRAHGARAKADRRSAGASRRAALRRRALRGVSCSGAEDRRVSRPCRSLPGKPSSPSPTCCCTTWAKGSPTDARTSWRVAASGARPPLWGIGLSQKVNGAGAFLHDGRARNFSEAILWHGGEAQVSREAFRQLSREDREALIAFLQSL